LPFVPTKEFSALSASFLAKDSASRNLGSVSSRLII